MTEPSRNPLSCWGLSHVPLLVLVFGAPFLGGCDTQGCAAGCVADCLSDCGRDCSGCDDCACGDACAFGPIPGGFPSGQDPRGDRRIPNATQVRLTPDGLRFLESQLNAVAQSTPIPIEAGLAGGGAIGTDVDILLCAERVGTFTAPNASVAECFDGDDKTTDATYTAAASGRGILGVSSPFGTTLLTTFGVYDLTAGRTVCTGGHLAPNAGYCDFPVVAGHRYRFRVIRQACGIEAASAQVFLPADQGCALHADVAGTPTLAPVDSFVELNASVRAQSFDGAGNRAAIPVIVYQRFAGIGLGFQRCSIDVDTGRSAPDVVSMRVQGGVVPSAERPGFGRLGLGAFNLAENSIQASDLSSTCNFFGLSLQQVYDLVTTFTGDPAEVLTEAVDEARDDISRLCQQAVFNPSTGAQDLCPGTSVPISRTVERQGEMVLLTECYGFDDTNGNGTREFFEPIDADCLPQILGSEARVDLSDALGAITPGLRAAVDLLFAVSDDAHAANQGYSVPLYGGFDSLDAARCTPTLSDTQLSALGLSEPPMDIDMAAAFEGGADTNHLQAGLSERVMNWGLYQLWRSGALCIEATTRLDQLLSTGLFSLFVRSLDDLSFPAKEVALGITLRPALPPRIVLGEDTHQGPLMTLQLPELAVDFYVFTNERYARFMTFTANVDVDLDVDIDDAGRLTPVIERAELSDTRLSNHELVREDPALVTHAVEGVVPLALSMAAGAVPTLDPSTLLSAAGFPIGLAPLRPGAFRTVVDVGDGGEPERFLGLFVDLAAAPAAIVENADTQVELLEVALPAPGEFELERFPEAEGARVEFVSHAEGPVGTRYEYQARVDGSTWSAWSSSPYGVLSGGTLRLEGRHQLEVRARVVGLPASTDLTPARVSFLVDVRPPSTQLIMQGSRRVLQVSDAVSRADTLLYRLRAAGEAGASWSDWAVAPGPEFELPARDGALEIEVRDEAGNVARVGAALRGLPPPSDPGDEGCGSCATGGAPVRGAHAFLVAMILLLLMGRGASARQRW
ncbi:MAG: hypothetical protein H6726_23080 [Sandaracinaceae bacterium]|nr:hypothetical protein [Sandaracinaceae bacterium]